MNMILLCAAGLLAGALSALGMALLGLNHYDRNRR